MADQPEGTSPPLPAAAGSVGAASSNAAPPTEPADPSPKSLPDQSPASSPPPVHPNTNKIVEATVQEQKLSVFRRISQALISQAFIGWLGFIVLAATFWISRPLWIAQIPLTEAQIPLTDAQTTLTKAQIPLTEQQAKQVQLDIARLLGEEQENNRRFLQAEASMKAAQSAAITAEKAFQEAQAQTSAMNLAAFHLREQNITMEKNIRIQRYVDYLARRPIVNLDDIISSDFINEKGIKIEFKFGLSGVSPNSYLIFHRGGIIRGQADWGRLPECTETENFDNWGAYTKTNIISTFAALTPREREDLRQGQIAYNVWGRHCYMDLEGGINSTDFCVRFDNFSSRRPCAGWNWTKLVTVPPHHQRAFRELADLSK